MEIQRLVRRTAVGGFVVAGGVVLAQSAASAQEAGAKPTPVKKQVLEEQAPASKAATAARARKAAAAPTKKPAAPTKKPASTTKATTKPTTKPTTWPTKVSPTPVTTAPAAAAPVATAVVAPAPATPAPTAQTAVAVDVTEAPALPPVDGPVDSNGDGPATDITLVNPQASTGAGSAQEVSSEQPVAAGPPPPDDATATAAALSATASPVLVSTAPNASTAQLTGTSPNGQITITINQPLPGTVVPPGTPVLVTGTVSVGGPTAINVIYVIDVSGSTSDPGGACGDPNGDGSADTILDCEIQGITALNNSLGNANVDVSLVAFSSDGAALDLSPAAGDQFTTGPTTDVSGNGVPDVIDVLNSLTFGGGTDFDAALAAVQALIVPGEQNFVFFLSDGQSSVATGPGSPLQAVADAGAQVLTFAVGGGTAGCGAGESLEVIAGTTGGTCTEVADPSQLSTALTGFTLAGIDRVEIEVNGFIGIATVSPLGFFSIEIPADLLLPGANTIIARAFGAGDQAGQVAVADTTVIVGNRVGGAGFDFDEFFLDFDEDEDEGEGDEADVQLAGILPVTGGTPGHKAATGALSFLLGGLLLGSGRHLRRRRRSSVGA